ncbi:MAG: heterodisulfide reductase-related iron-sulfur binding cluster [Planctomycetaceae bacterium]
MRQCRIDKHPRFQPKSLPVTAAYHTPCHTRALAGLSPWLELLEKIPNLELVPLELGCSGMAGAYGLTQKNFAMSMRIGADLIDRMRQPDLQIGLAECSSCKLQMEQGTSTPTLHPLKLLAFACGLIPASQIKLTPNNRSRVAT